MEGTYIVVPRYNDDFPFVATDESDRELVQEPQSLSVLIRKFLFRLG